MEATGDNKDMSTTPILQDIAGISFIRSLYIGFIIDSMKAISSSER